MNIEAVTTNEQPGLQNGPQTTNSVTTVLSFANYEFDYRQNYWTLDRNTTVNTSGLYELEPVLAERVRETLVYYAETGSAKHVENLISTLNLFVKETSSKTFTELNLTAWKNSLSKEHEYKLGVLRVLLRQMRILSLNDHIEDGVYELTDQWRLSGNRKGYPVVSLDPETGPFSDIEFEAIGHQSAHFYAEGRITTEEYATILLFKATGRRPEQIASLKVGDFNFLSKLTGRRVYVINIPRIKQRGAKFRTRFREVAVVDWIGQVIELHIKVVIMMATKVLGRKLSDEERVNLPLFLDENSIATIGSLSAEDVGAYLKTEDAHLKSTRMTTILKEAIGKLQIISERTQEPLHINAYRFRYTLGTRATREGAGPLVVARLLDHSDTQHVDIYSRNNPEYAAQISAIMNSPLARYAAAFTGKLVEDEDEANQENPGATRIPCREKDCDVGSCGSNSFCQDYAPVACYLCPKFRPWVHAPHYLVLRWLMEQREVAKQDTVSDDHPDGDLAIAAINDRAIMAVCQVIKQVEEYQANVG